MNNEDFWHPIEATKPIAGLAIASLFTGLGVTMIDPRVGLGVISCCLGVGFTIILYYKNMRAMRQTAVAQWPWFGMFLILYEIAAPAYVFVSRAKAEIPIADKSKLVTPPVTAPNNVPPVEPAPDSLKFAKPFDCNASFMNVSPGAKVEGFTVEGGTIEGFDQDFKIEGTMKNTKLKNFKSKGASNKPCDGSPPKNHVHIDEMRIDRVGP